MIPRRLTQNVLNRLSRFPAVALLGPRQVGKTTLAKIVAHGKDSLYLDLEAPADREKLLGDAALYLKSHQDKLIILDEIQRAPELFQTLRGLIDEARQQGRNSGLYLLLGSASIDLLKQSGETLAGRISYVELHTLDALEAGETNHETLWVRGGFPNSFLAADEEESVMWRADFIQTYLERDIPQFGLKIPVETLRRFWIMLAHSQGGMINAAELARSLAVDGKTVARYIDLMVDLLLARRLTPCFTNTKKRLVKSPKIYVRDSGLVHTLLQLDSREAILAHPIVGASWEGFVIENLIAAAPSRALPSFYRTAAGAEIDLILDLPGGQRWAIEIKRGLTTSPGKGFYQACEDVQPHQAFVVYAGKERYPISQGAEAVSLGELAGMLAVL